MVYNYLAYKIKPKKFNKYRFLRFDFYQIRGILADGSGKKQFD